MKGTGLKWGVVLVVALLWGCAGAVSAATWKFLVYGDSRSNNTSNPINVPILTELAAQTLVEDPAFVLFPGDLVYTGSQASFNTWTNIMGPVYAAGIGVCVVAGNHEVNGGSAAMTAFKSMFIAPYTNTPFAGMTNLVVDGSTFDGRSYSFEFSNALFLCMDNYSNTSTSAHCVNQAFLDARLAARNPNTTPLVFAMWHEPAFKAGSDTGLEAKPSLRNATWTSLQNAGCRQVFNGHDHACATARLDDGDGDSSNDTYQAVVGTAGAPLYTVAYSGDTGFWTVAPISSESQFGYLRVVVDDDARTVTQTWVHRTGVNTYVDTANVMSYTYETAQMDPYVSWQMQYFDCTDCPAAQPDADPDGDDLNNDAEFHAGTDPTNSASGLRITGLALEGDNVRVYWATAGGHTNQLEYLLPLGEDGSYRATNQNWGPVASPVVVLGSGDTITNAVDLGGATNGSSRYYRIRLLQ